MVYGKKMQCLSVEAVEARQCAVFDWTLTAREASLKPDLTDLQITAGYGYT